MSVAPTRKLPKMLPCPGNIAGGAKHRPTTLPGQGSAFQRLPCRRRGCGSVRELSSPLVWPFGVVADVWAVWSRCFVARAQKKSLVHQCSQDGSGCVGVLYGRRGRWFGRLCVSWTRRAECSVFVARVHESKKKPVNVGLQDF